MTAADLYAEALIEAVDLQDDPWREPETEYALEAFQRPGKLRLAALYAGGGAWGTFLGITCWWAYEFVTAAETAAVVAQLN